MTAVRCPRCGADDLDYAGRVDDGPDTPMVCEAPVGRRLPDGDAEGVCGWRGTLGEAEEESRAHGAYCTLGCTGPWHRPECALAGTTRYTR